MTPAQRSEINRANALEGWARRSRREHGEKIRQARMQMFMRRVDPDGVLSESERLERAQAAIAAHAARMRAAKARAS